MADLQPIELNRPQYVMAPEALVTALAWMVFTSPDAYPSQTRPVAYIYRSEASRARSLDLRTTYPYGSGALLEFTAGLAGIHAQGAEEQDLVGLAVASSIQGTRPRNGKGQLASPLTPHLALLQDVRGFQGTAHPPDYGRILEQLYRLGIPAGESRAHPALLWLNAADRRRQQDVMLGHIDAAVASALLPFQVVRNSQQALPMRGIWNLEHTPFSWFVEAWGKLTRPDWVDALPARVWVDWATTVLRLALGLGYLWEAAWYESLGRRIVSGSTEFDDIAKGLPEVVPWRPSDAKTSVRDVASLLLWRVRRGNKVRDVLQKRIGPEKSSSLDLRDPGFLKDIDSALSNPGTAVNTWEAIRYALMTRDPAGPFADHYGLLRSSGRFLWVQPGTEWMAVVASLACDAPDGKTDVRHVMGALRALGLQPELRDVLLLLEAAGLARGSADADYGVEVRSAF
jgi:hypothetical protein